MDAKDIKIGMWVRLKNVGQLGLAAKVTSEPRAFVPDSHGNYWGFSVTTLTGESLQPHPDLVEPWIPRPGEWVRNVAAPHLEPFQVVDVRRGGQPYNKSFLFAYNYRQGEQASKANRSCRIDFCSPCLPPSEQTSAKSTNFGTPPIGTARVELDAQVPRPTEFVLGSSSVRPGLQLMQVVGRPGVFYDPKYDRTFYGGTLNAVVEGPPKHLERIRHQSTLFREIDPATGGPVSDRIYSGVLLDRPDAEFFWRPRVGDRVAPRTDTAKTVFRCGVHEVAEIFASLVHGWRVRVSNAVSLVHVSHLELVERNDVSPTPDTSETHLVPVHGQPGLYCEVKQSPDGKMTVGPVQHELGANTVCRVCKGPAYLGLGLEPPKCLAPVCEPAKEPEPKTVVRIMHDPYGCPWRAEKIWQASRTSELGDLIKGEHPFKEQAVAVFRENWKKRRR